MSFDITVAYGDPSHAEAAAEKLEQRLRALPRIQTECTSVALLENSSGRWEEMHVFTLPSVGVV